MHQKVINTINVEFKTLHKANIRSVVKFEGIELRFPVNFHAAIYWEDLLLDEIYTSLPCPIHNIQ